MRGKSEGLERGVGEVGGGVGHSHCVVCEMLPSMGDLWALLTGPIQQNHRAGQLLHNLVSTVNEAFLVNKQE